MKSNILLLFFICSVLLLANLALATAIGTRLCGSPLYCKSKKAKYMSMNQISDAILDVPVIGYKTTTDIASCQGLSLKLDGCYSININIATPNSYVCRMLGGNVYANADMLKKALNFIHLYIEVRSV